MERWTREDQERFELNLRKDMLNNYDRKTKQKDRFLEISSRLLVAVAVPVGFAIVAAVIVGIIALINWLVDVL